MKSFKKLLIMLCIVALTLPYFNLAPLAAETPACLINGENVHCEGDMAVIYNVGNAKKNQWSYDVILNSDYTVAEIVENGDIFEGEYPEGSIVISATGSKVDWFKDNVSVGDTLYYDGYTKRLFVCDKKGEFNPYFSKEFDIEEFQGKGYSIMEEDNADVRTDYTFGVSINDETVLERGGSITLYDGEKATAVFATTAKSRNELIAYAPLGAHCDIDDGIASFSFDKSRLDDGIKLALNQANEIKLTAEAEFDYINFSNLNAIIDEANTLLKGKIDYKDYSAIMEKLTEEIELIRTENKIGELRGAYHVPTEKTDTEVRATVLSAKAAGLNSLILRVSNGYGSFIPLPEGNKFKQNELFGGFDVLKSYIKICKDEGVALALCIDVYYNEYASLASPDWVSKSNSGSEDGLVTKYYSPANQNFVDYYLDYVEYIVTNYDIKTVMFDYLRYPKFSEKTDLGYDYETIERFANEYEIPITEANDIKNSLFESIHWAKWVEFRSKLVSDMAKAISETVKTAREDVTTLVVAERDTVNHYYMQSATNWVKDGLFDGVLVAFYENDSDEGNALGANDYYADVVLDKAQTYSSIASIKDSYFFIGLDSGSGIDSILINDAGNDARLLGADGFIFSSLSDLYNQNYHRELASGILRGTVASPLGDTEHYMSKILNYTKLKIFDHIRTLGGCEEEVALAALDRIDQALAELSKGKLSYDYCKTLESDMAMIFATSAGKDKALEEFKSLTKIALLAKEEREQITPPEEETNQPEDSSSPEGEESVFDESESGSDVTEESNSDVTSQPDSTSGNGGGISAGIILIYCFVGLTAVAVIATMVITVLRRSKIDPDHHMPKGSKKGYEDKE